MGDENYQIAIQPKNMSNKDNWLKSLPALFSSVSPPTNIATHMSKGIQI